jgi:hypothetical protein
MITLKLQIMRIKKKNIREALDAQIVKNQIGDVVDAVKDELDTDDAGAKEFVKSMAEGETSSNVVEFLEDKPGEERFKINGVTWQYVWAKYPDGRRDIGVYRVGQDMVYDIQWFTENVLPSPKSNELTEDESSRANRSIEYGQTEPELGRNFGQTEPELGGDINYGEKEVPSNPDLPFEGKIYETKVNRKVIKTIKVRDLRK